MVIRSVASGLGAVSSLCSSTLSLLAVVALSMPAWSQAPAGVPGPSPSANPQPVAGSDAVTGSDAKASPQDPAAQPAEVVDFGKIVADKVSLRCWAGSVAAPPQYEDVLEKDQVVRLGRTMSGFREVLLPLGPVGYVSKRFVAESPDGTVRTKGAKVSFRYRPRTTEAPVTQMADGTVIHVIGEQDEWFRARVRGVEAWVALAEVEVVDGDDPKVQAAVRAMDEKMQAEAQARLDAIAAEQAKAKQAAIDLEAVKVVETAFQAEKAKPLADQDFAPLKSALDKVSESLGKDSGAQPAVAALAKRIETHSWIREASIVANEEAPAPSEPVVKPPVKDGLDRFQSIGWLRYERRLAGPGIYYLEKGGRRQFELSCNTGRYDLSLFVGREVGIIGPRRSPLRERMTVLDVERLEVLGPK